MFDLKKCRGVLWWRWRVMQNLKKHWLVEKMTGIWQIFTRALKSLKIETLIKFYDLKTHIGVMCHDNEEWCKIWRRIDLSFQNWHEEFKRILIRALESLKNFHFNGFLLSKVYIVWAKKVQRSYLSWSWRGIQNLERNRLVASKLAKGI